MIRYFVEQEILEQESLGLIMESQSAIQLKEKELELKYRLEEKRLEYEREEREKRLLLENEREEKERDRQFQLQMKELELRSQSENNTSRYNQNFDVTKHIRLVPPFQEKEVDKYFMHFEKVAENLKWPKEHWTLLLQSSLIGKAREIYTQLSPAQSTDYEKVKEIILKGYELVPEAYRQKFRNCKKEENQTHVEFARSKEQLFDRWCMSKKIEQSHDKLRQLMLVEEFKRCLRPDIKSFLDEKQVETLDEAARLADDYSLTHKTSFVNKTTSFRPHSHSRPSPVATPSPVKSSSEPNNRSRVDYKDHNPTSKLMCSYCRKPGHLVSNCYKLKNRNHNVGDMKPTGFTTLSVKPQSYVEQNKVHDVVKPKSDSVMEVYEPFLSEGFVSLQCDLLCPPTPVTILRDTGASQSLILAEILPFCDKSYSGSSVLIQGVECGSLNVPLHNIKLKSDLVTGPVTVGVRPSLPFPGVHLLLGNDLAGDKVVVNPVVTDTPVLDYVPDSNEQEIPELYPSCAVTRAMAKKATLDSSKNEVELSDTFIGQIFGNEVSSTLCDSLSQKQSVCESVCESDLSRSSSSQGHDTRSRSQLINEQQNDPELKDLYHKALGENEVSEVPVCYYLKNGVLLRKWRPLDVPADEEWSVKHQIVVPKSYRSEILSIAHETPLAGHLGVNKTYDKILNHFYWPGIRQDVVNFCKSCHTCQLVGKPNQTIPKSPLQPIPAFEEPFSRIIIDCVGPLPKTRSGCEYMLTIMCASTRFPEAIPLRNIKAKTIVKALVKFFTFVGLPKSVQSDQGSNFMSGLFQQVMHELGIKQYRSSAYHPESQGALERFHQTLKNMIRTYCFDTNSKNWDEGVHLLLFAVREAVQESLGFSPFELVFGHSVRGPLKLLKEKLLDEDESQLSLLQYVSDFRERLTDVCDLARSNLENAQSKMKDRYDVKTVDRSFEPGDSVLALLPIPGSPLQARYFGPYIVDKKVSDLNYVINTPGRRKQKQMCHVNMLKKYINRDSSFVKPVSVVGSVPPESSDCDENCVSDIRENTDPGPAKLQNSDILRNLDQKLSHLNEYERGELKQLLHEYEHLFPDIPTRTDKISHDVILEDTQPIKQHPYRMNPVKQQCLKDEVKYLLENDFIEPSQSNYSSPCILVPKSNGTYRMCTDYRKINAVTKTDSFPIPRIDDCIDNVGKAKYVTKFDLLKGFWQVPLTDRAKEISAFVTPDGLFQYKVMPFGMKNSPATFQRLINSILAGLDNCKAYIDDVIIYTETFDDHLQTIRAFFDRLTEAMLTINLEKSEFCHATLTFLGHVVGQGQVKPVDSKVQAISEFPEPNCKRQLMRFLGMAGYYRKFCSNFSVIAEPLTNLLRKGTKFVWNDRCQIAFDKLKAILKSTPVLLAPDFNKCFKLAVDASDVGAGAVLIQEDDNGIDHPVCYFSKKFNTQQRNYSTIEKECLALILAIQHFEVYLTSSPMPIVVFSDHNPLSFLHKLKNKNQRLLRWSLMLQEYNLEIRHIKGRDNIIPDALSRV
ncbi:RNase H-like domain-containing protein [Campylobacter sp. CS_ED1]|uniref:reverse transcriptase domain-containing protein n=1 Tax=Campylobacter sp. CS_ED1 TaxID=2984140 RepID=UPI0022EA0FCC|nr:reverse transcriptase domain-containing protein [Campylobacter sp. CS_ED1]MDA3086465.1 RNase H-like domain-containing protein [Campylobacter sp. CS_ED1]